MEGAVLSGKLCAKEINDLSKQLKLAESIEKTVEKEVQQKAPISDLVIS